MSATGMQVRLVEDRETTVVTGPGYRVEVTAQPPTAVLTGADGAVWSRLSLLASLDRTDAVDETVGAARVSAVTTAAGVQVDVELPSSAWRSKRTRLLCTDDGIELSASVAGTGTLADVTLLGGRAVLPNGACGSFRSSIGFASVFSPGPTEPVQVVRPSASAATLGVVGDASPGRLHGIFSPPPLCLAFGRREADHATAVPHGPWLGLWVRAAAALATFTELRYEPLDGGFHLVLDHDGHTAVDGDLTTPTLVLRAVADPWAALRDHREDLVDHGLAPAVPTSPRAAWWTEPIFCGWGAQCARAAAAGAAADPVDQIVALGGGTDVTTAPAAADLARQDVYDELLARLLDHGLVPGTIVVDDRWEHVYGTGEPHPDRWPDLRGWIADRHAAGQRVLLWWKAWDPAGVPAEECVRDATGRPVSVDPGNPAYRERLARIVTAMVAADGLDADGFKVDFTQRAPAGRSLTAWTDSRPGQQPVWGVAALHRLLATVHDAAKAVKPDALVITHTPHPGFADVCDMVRTNDVLERDPSGRPVPVADQLAFRAEVVRASLPGHLVDTDQWPMPDRAEWLSYAEHQVAHGVPALYYAERMDRTGEEITAADLAAVARTWHRHRTGAR